MSKQYNYFRIGLFIVISIIILIALLIALGGSKVFEKKEYIETYFGESVQGLQEGSVVKYLGIDIGHVESIGLLRQVYPNLIGKLNGSRYIYVKIAVTSNNFANNNFINSLPKQITKGLRAQLEPQGLTGASYLSLTFLSPSQNPPIQLNIKFKNAYPYIPSATSTITRFTDAINNVFSNIKQDNIPQLLRNTKELAATANQAIKQANVAGISQDMHNTLMSVANTAKQYESLAKKLLSILQKKQVNETIGNIANITKTLQETTLLANRTLTALNRAANSSNQVLMQFKVNEQTLLNNAKETSSNIKTLTNNAKEYPSQLIFSKPPPHLNPNTL